MHPMHRWDSHKPMGQWTLYTLWQVPVEQLLPASLWHNPA
jgi:hypothetical protein